MKKGAVILCGGKSSRMGRDKATLPFGPELMLQRIVRLVGEVVDPKSIVVVAAKSQNLPSLPPEIILATDEQPDRGPLEGLAAGLRSLPPDVDAFYATSCDVPLLVPEFVNAMFERLTDHDIAVPCDGQYFHPLSAVYRPRIQPIVQQLLATNQLRPTYLFDHTHTAKVPTTDLQPIDPHLDTLMNLNHPEDYQKALKKSGFAQA